MHPYSSKVNIKGAQSIAKWLNHFFGGNPLGISENFSSHGGLVKELYEGVLQKHVVSHAYCFEVAPWVSICAPEHYVTYGTVFKSER